MILIKLWCWFILFLVGCGGSERMEVMYAERCLGCHGPSGRGDGPLISKLPVTVPDFRDTAKNRTVSQIRKAISEGKGMMPAFEPALRPGEIQDMVYFVRLLSRRDRPVEWWEKFDTLVWAHCSVPSKPSRRWHPNAISAACSLTDRGPVG
jgi:hypothetical protein